MLENENSAMPHKSGQNVGKLGWIALAVAILKAGKTYEDDHVFLGGLKEYVTSLSENEVCGL